MLWLFFCFVWTSSVWWNPGGDGGNGSQPWFPWQLPEQQRLHLENLPASWFRWAASEISRACLSGNHSLKDLEWHLVSLIHLIYFGRCVQKCFSNTLGRKLLFKITNYVFLSFTFFLCVCCVSRSPHTISQLLHWSQPWFSRDTQWAPWHKCSHWSIQWSGHSIFPSHDLPWNFSVFPQWPFTE